MMSVGLKKEQIEALGRMHDGCILCGDTGSGKSRTALAYFYTKFGGKIYNQDDPKAVSDDFCPMKDPCDLYIITTAQKRNLHEWDGELATFAMSTDDAANYYSNKVFVDSWQNMRKYIEVTRAFFVFDEQHLTGNGKWAKEFLKISGSNKWILLSATPGDNWMDYATVFIANGYFKNRSDFINRHVIYKRFSKFPEVDRYVHEGFLYKCRANTVVYMDRAREIEKKHVKIRVSYDEVGYKAVQKTEWNPYKDKPIETASEICSVLRHIVNSDPSRIDALLDIFREHSRIIVFYNYMYELFILENTYFGDGVAVAEWNGLKHEPVPKSGPWVYLVQYTAGSEGWNCKETDTIVFYSLSYSYKQMHQAEGRIDRMNTPYDCLFYYYLVSTAKIDLAVMRALRNKKDFNERKFIG